MKPSELRIGNIATINNPEHWPLLKDVPLIVQGVNKCTPLKDVENTDYGVQLFDNSDFKTRYSATKTFSQFICFVEPIRLTEEWILKFGLKRFQLDGVVGLDRSDPNEKTTYYEMGKITIVQWGENTPFFLSNNNLRIELKYVHQFQNVMFALVGEELVLQD